jgi:hypothetical protein
VQAGWRAARERSFLSNPQSPFFIKSNFLSLLRLFKFSDAYDVLVGHSCPCCACPVKIMQSDRQHGTVQPKPQQLLLLEGRGFRSNNWQNLICRLRT